MRHVKLFEQFINEADSGKWVVACYGEVEDLFYGISEFEFDMSDNGDIAIFILNASSESDAINKAKAEVGEILEENADDVEKYIAKPLSDFNEYIFVEESDKGIEFKEVTPEIISKAKTKDLGPTFRIVKI